jgi:large subunit ribosomal protein L43
MNRIAQASTSAAAAALPKTVPVQGYNHFLTPLRKLVIDYDPLSPSQSGVQ